jgi:hypothetical protein
LGFTGYTIRKYIIAAVDSRTSNGDIRCKLDMIPGMGLPVLSNPPDTTVPIKNKPVTNTAINAIALRGVTW